MDGWEQFVEWIIDNGVVLDDYDEAEAVQEFLASVPQEMLDGR